MDMIFDTATGELTIDTSSVQSWGADLRAMLERHGYTINLRGVQMRLTITADGDEVFDMVLPPPNVKYKQTDQDVIATGRVYWSPDQEIHAEAWCLTSGGFEVSAVATFTAPRPPQPYPSWTWEDGAWQPPIPYPSEGDWVWDEDLGDWVQQ